MAQARTIDAAGLTIAYREAGAGAPLLLLHGIGAAAESFAPQLESLARDFRVIAWDAPGYGGSSDHSEPRPTPAHYAEAAVALLDALQIERAHVLGHSLGALIAASLARRHPMRVARLILVSAASGYALTPGAAYPLALQSRLDDLEKLGPAGMAEARAARLCAPDARPAALAAVRRVMAQIRPTGYRQAVALLAQGEIARDLPHISCPTLVLCGARDVITPPDRVRALTALLRDGRYRELPGLGHACYVEAPDAFAAALHEFLERVA
jgi:pimeloyl-ACP methyl ester carboxylesterase